MNSESMRLHTFFGWPRSAPVDPPRIAKAGFFYTGVEMEVQCFSCNFKITNWNHGDKVMWRHMQLNPQCEFLVNPAHSGNIPKIDVVAYSNNDLLAHWNEREESSNNVNQTQHDYGLTEEDEIYRNDALRLLSFLNWEDSTISRETLVNAGFYHAGNGRLRCAWCGGELPCNRSVASLRSPIEIHRMYFPRCRHAATVAAAQSSTNTNLPIPQSTPSATPPTRTTENNDLSSGAAHNTRILNSGPTWQSLGVVGSGARHPNQASLTARLATFDRWPTNKTQLPRAMAEAGFFHTDTEDQVRCFYCDGGLGRWEAGDAPWVEHARWFPTCGYVILVKGPEFIQECRNNRTEQSTVLAPTDAIWNIRDPGNEYLVNERRVIDEAMESAIGLGALGAGLDAARVRRALLRRYRSTGGRPFRTAESLIDAVLHDQLNEQAWSVSTQSDHLARNILTETLRELGVPQRRETQSSTSESDEARTPSPRPPVVIDREPRTNRSETQPIVSSQPNLLEHPNQNQTASQPAKVECGEVKQKTESETKGDPEASNMSLEEENRQLKEAKLCKVCMDSEVSVVFLPCGHLVSCARCGAALPMCPMCRTPVRALVRAYLA